MLWGRSLGSVVVLMILNQVQSDQIVGAVVDSPFLNLKRFLFALVENMVKIPFFVKNMIFNHIRGNVQKEIEVDIEEISTLKYCEAIFLPILVVYGTLDEYISKEDIQQIYSSLSSQHKTLLEFELKHADLRKQATKVKILQEIGKLVKPQELHQTLYTSFQKNIERRLYSNLTQKRSSVPPKNDVARDSSCKSPRKQSV